MPEQATERRIQRMKTGLEAFNRTGSIDRTWLAPDFELHQASSIVDTAGTFRGPDALHDSLQELRESFEDLRFEAERFEQAPDGAVVVFVRVRGRGRGSRMEIDNLIAWVVTYHDDQAARIVVYEEPSEALAAAGLSA